MGDSGAVDPCSPTVSPGDDRRIMNGIFYVLRTGIPWRDLPERYGPYTSAYNRFNRWSRRGAWKRIFDALAAKSPQFVLDRQHDCEIASRSQRRQRGEKNQAIGISRGGR